MRTGISLTNGEFSEQLTHGEVKPSDFQATLHCQTAIGAGRRHRTGIADSIRIPPDVD